MRLKAENINFRYNCGHLILENVNFSVESGEIVGLWAPSGFGKTTLTKLLAGYMEAESGRIVIDGCDKNTGNCDQKRNKWRRGAGIGKGREKAKSFNPVQLIFQHPEKAVNPRWKMEKVMKEAGEPSRELIEAMGIKNEWMNRWPSELSGGELQRFCVLRALNPHTKFLIADEMTAMLDAVTQAQIWNVVVKYVKERHIGMVVISHDKELMARLCDRVVEL